MFARPFIRRHSQSNSQRSAPRNVLRAERGRRSELRELRVRYAAHALPRHGSWSWGRERLWRHFFKMPIDSFLGRKPIKSCRLSQKDGIISCAANREFTDFALPEPADRLPGRVYSVFRGSKGKQTTLRRNLQQMKDVWKIFCVHLPSSLHNLYSNSGKRHLQRQSTCLNQTAGSGFQVLSFLFKLLARRLKLFRDLTCSFHSLVKLAERRIFQQPIGDSSGSGMHLL